MTAPPAAQPAEHICTRFVNDEHGMVRCHECHSPAVLPRAAQPAEPPAMDDLVARLSVCAPSSVADDAIAELQRQAREIARWNELHRVIAEELDCDQETWPDHRNAPLAIGATFVLIKQRAERAEAERDAAKEELQSVLDDWNAIVRASGSPTNGGAVGHVAALCAERDALRECVRAADAMRRDGFLPAPDSGLITVKQYDAARAKVKP